VDEAGTVVLYLAANQVKSFCAEIKKRGNVKKGI